MMSEFARETFPVHVAEFRIFDYRAFTVKPEEKVEEFWKYFEKWLRSIDKDSSLNEGQGVVLIVDFNGYALKHVASPAGYYFLFNKASGKRLKR